MAGTYTPQQVVALIQQFAHGVPITGVEANVCDVVNSYIWSYYPWSWTIGSMTPITLIDGTQDYNPTDTNIQRFLKVRIVRTDTVPAEAREMAMLDGLGVELTRRGGIDTNTAFGYFASSNTLRLMYAASVGTGQSIQLQGEFQKQPTRITDATMTTPFAFPDQYVWMFMEGVKYFIYQFSDDQRAGGVQMSKNGRFQQNYAGQYATFMHMLNYAARTEDLSRGDQFQFPDNALGQGRSYWPGLYGI